MSNDFYFKPDKVRLGTDFRDPKQDWFLQIILEKPCAGIAIKISKKDKENIIKFIKDLGYDKIDLEETHSQHLESDK